ncbi:MAG: hypothetical protein VB042_07275 [Victivallaceae bacterium]|nr:hypothetical protein [Victivallaceae bacterium]
MFENEIACYSRNEYPSLAAQFDDWGRSMPFKGVRVLDATPVFRNTLAKHRALIAGGAELTVGVTRGIMYDREVAEILRVAGIRVAENLKNGDFDLVLDCAGLHAGNRAKYGYVELTRSGLHRYGRCPSPVVSADSGRIKLLETCLGTGDGFIRAMRQLGHADFTGRKLVVFGCGKVGRGVAMYAAKAGADVTVVDDISRVAPPDGCSIVDMNDSAAIERVTGGAWCVVSATGIKGAWSGRFELSSLLASSALIANMGVEDEFGPEVPAARVLNRKKPLNFILAEPTRLKYLEATMALDNALALALLGGGFAPSVNLPPETIEQQIMNLTFSDGVIGDEITEMKLYE